MALDPIVEQGRVRYTRHGYRCRKCGYNFFVYLTSPVFQCPSCGNIVNDKMAYYVSRFLRAISSAFAFMWLTFIPGIYYQDAMLFVPGIIVFVIATGVLLYKQMWSLIVTRIVMRAVIIIAITAIPLIGLIFAMNALGTDKPDGGLLVAALLAISLILTIISLLFFKINGKTFDYPQASNESSPARNQYGN